MRSAAAPSIATMTVIPAPSSASVRRRSVSGESSTTRAMSRFLDSAIMAVQCLQGCYVPIEIEAIDQGAHFEHEITVFGMIGADFIELDLDGPDIAELPEIDQLFDVPRRRPRPATRLPLRRGGLLVVILPFDLEELTDQFQQPGNIDRLHEVAVMERLRQWGAVGLQ